MRRILSACLLQTMRFDTVSDIPPEKEFEIYCKRLNQKNTKYEIVDKKEEAGGALVVKIKRQYNTYDTSGYMD